MIWNFFFFHWYQTKQNHDWSRALIHKAQPLALSSKFITMPGQPQKQRGLQKRLIEILEPFDHGKRKKENTTLAEKKPKQYYQEIITECIILRKKM